jgi:hypothetical protein
MTEKKEIADQPLKGVVTIKQVIAFATGVAFIVGFYFSMIGQIKRAMEVSQGNQDILKEIQNDRQESERVNNIRLTNIELDQREAKIRLTQLENK